MRPRRIPTPGRHRTTKALLLPAFFLPDTANGPGLKGHEPHAPLLCPAAVLAYNARHVHARLSQTTGDGMSKHLVLAGAGHAHMMVLEALPELVSQGVRVTVIGPGPRHYYSGMGPGMLGGAYQPQDTQLSGAGHGGAGGRGVLAGQGGWASTPRARRCSPRTTARCPTTCFPATPAQRHSR